MKTRSRGRLVPPAAAALALLLLAQACLAAPFAYVARNASGQVAVVDLASNVIVANISVGASPLGVAVDAAGARAYVTNSGNNTVSVISTASNAVVGTINASPGPLGVAVNPAGTRFAVALAGDANPGSSVAVFDAATFVRVGTANVGSGPTGVAFNPAGTRLYVTNTNGHTISVVDASTLVVLATIPVLQGPLHPVVNAAGTRLYVSHIGTENVDVNRVTVIDLASNSVAATIAVGTNPVGIALNAAGTRLVVANPDSNNVSVIDTASNAVIGTVAAGTGPISAGFHPDGSRFYVVSSESGELITFDASSFGRLASTAISGMPVAFGNFIAGGASSSGTNAPGVLSGLWWNPAENGWGINFTQRGNIIFAAWYTYDAAGNPKWYVASNCAVTGSACNGTLYEVSGPRFFGVNFFPQAMVVRSAGSLNVAFQGNDNASMTYTVAGQTRTVAISRQVFQATGATPATNYTDLWWNPSESGWGLAVTQQFRVMFLAWYVYNAAGNPVWYVVSNCAVNAAGNGCSGTIYRTTGPPFGPVFTPGMINVVEVGSATLSFSDGNNGMLSFVVDGVAGTKAITRQIF
jgi:YVTN family beta-propeller protein